MDLLSISFQVGCGNAIKHAFGSIILFHMHRFFEWLFGALVRFLLARSIFFHAWGAVSSECARAERICAHTFNIYVCEIIYNIIHPNACFIAKVLFATIVSRYSTASLVDHQFKMQISWKTKVVYPPRWENLPSKLEIVYWTPSLQPTT